MSAARGLVTALRTLTILRVPGRDAERVVDSLPWFPVAGLLIGMIVWAGGWVCIAARELWWQSGAAWAMLVAGTLLTGALHLDGVGDCADALGARGSRERALAIMKDSHMGAFGVIALVLLLLGKWITYARIIGHDRLYWVIVACVLARVAQVAWIVREPYARAQGTAGAFVQDARPRHLAWALVFGVLIVALLGGAFADIGRKLLAVALTGGIVLAWARWCRTRFGGITGDTIGAGSELTELAVLLVAAWR